MVLQEDTLQLVKDIEDGFGGEFIKIKKGKAFKFLDLALTNHLSSLQRALFNVGYSDVLGLRTYCKEQKEASTSNILESYTGVEAFFRVFDTLFELKEYRNCMRYAYGYVYGIERGLPFDDNIDSFKILDNESTEEEREKEAARFKAWLIDVIKAQIKEDYLKSVKKNILISSANFNIAVGGNESAITNLEFRKNLFSSEYPMALNEENKKDVLQVINTYNQKAAAFLNTPDLTYKNEYDIYAKNIESFLKNAKDLDDEKTSGLFDEGSDIITETKYYFAGGIAEIFIPILLENVSDEFKENLYIVEDRSFFSNGKPICTLEDDCKKKAFGELKFIKSNELL